MEDIFVVKHLRMRRRETEECEEMETLSNRHVVECIELTLRVFDINDRVDERKSKCKDYCHIKDCLDVHWLCNKLPQE